MNMKKLLYVLLAALMLVAFTACKAEDENDGNAFDDYKDQTIEITEWTDAEGNTFFFEAVDSESITITGFSSTNYQPHAVKLPAYIDNRAVVGISESAFANNSAIEALELPKASDYEAGSSKKAKAAEEGKVPAFTIGDYAFRECTALKEITIPSYVTSLGTTVFYGCESLSSLNFEEGCSLTEIPVYAFAECTALTSVSIPAGVERIGAAAFFNCTAMETLSIADGVKAIGAQAFQNCTGIKHLEAPASITDVGLYAFSGCNSLEYASVPTWVIEPLDKSSLVNVTLVAGESIPDSAFKSCEKLETVVIACDLYEIGESAFVGCKNLREIEIPATVTSIGRAMFKNCSSLTKITIPAAATYIGESAFNGCTSLSEITIPKAVTEIGDKAFASCYAIKKIVVEESNPVFASVDNNLYSADLKVLLQYAVGSDVTDFEVPETVVEIKPAAFAGGVNLQTLLIPNTVETIGKGAFDGCVNISDVSLPVDAIAALAKDGLARIVITKGTEVAANAFADCLKLESVVLPDTITAIGDGAFKGCVKLHDITLPAGVTKIGASLFSGCESLTVAAIPAGVTSIGKEAFLNCKLLADISIPEGVTAIGENAFRNCASAPALNVPAGLEKIGANAFAGCASVASISVDSANKVYASIDGSLYNKAGTELLQYALGKDGAEVAFPATVTKIAAYAFQGSLKLETLVIPETITEIGEGAFADCAKLASATVPTWALGKISLEALVTLTVTAGDEIGAGAVANAPVLETVVIPYTVEKIDKTAFDGCLAIKTADIPNAAIAALPKVALVTLNINSDGDIASNAFKECITLETVTFGRADDPDFKPEVGKIGSDAFRDCEKLETINFLNRVTGMKEIGSNAFRDCKSLKSIFIGTNVSKIGSNALAGTISLTSIRVSTANKKFEDVDRLALYDEKKTELIQYALGNKDYSFAIPEGVEEIGARAFADAPHLASIELPKSLDKINSAAFSNCYKLTEIKNLSSLSIEAGGRGNGNIAIQVDESRLNVYSSGDSKLSEENGLVIFTFAGEKIVIGRANNKTTLNISKDVTQINKAAFVGISFKKVVFEGTKAEWEALEKGDNWDNGLSYTVQCSDETFKVVPETESAVA